MKSLKKIFKQRSKISKKKVFNKEKKKPLDLTEKKELKDLSTEISEKELKEKEEKPRNLWKNVNHSKYRFHATIIEPGVIDERTVYFDDLEKRKEVYGICGECNEPGTGERWCQSCNAKRFKDNFKNWSSGNKDIDKLIQQSQLNAVHFNKCLEWIPFEKFQNVTYITKGGFGKIYSAKWPEGYIDYWDIENQKWKRRPVNVALKSLDNSSKISADFLNEIKSYLQVYINDIVKYYGITQDPDTKNHMIVMDYYRNGSLRNYLNQSEESIPFKSKILHLLRIARGLLDIHNTGKVHKGLHSGNILFGKEYLFISDLGMCQPVNQPVKKEGVYGVLPYIAPEVLCGHQYTKAADIYSFGIVINEFIREEAPYDDVPHDHVLAVKICQGLRPTISEDTPKLLADLIVKCWDAEAESRPTAKELLQILRKWYYLGRTDDENGDTNYSQIKGRDNIRESKLTSSSNKNKLKNTQTHPEAIYHSRLLNFKDLPNPVNSSDLSSF